MAVDKPMIPKWNGAELKALREARGWSTIHLARLVGAHKSSVPRWEGEEGDRQTPGADYLAALSMLFGVPPMAFFTGQEGYNAAILKFAGEGALDADESQRWKQMKESPLPGKRKRAEIKISEGRRGKPASTRGHVPADRSRQREERPEDHDGNSPRGR